jgi:GTP cyclohydrolase I
MNRAYIKPDIDVQNQVDTRNIEIDKVGVKDISYPIGVLDRTGGVQRTVAHVNMYVNLPQQFKGTHMSRFIELLNEHCDNMTTTRIPRILRDMRKRLDAREAHIEVKFPYFILKQAPVSGAEGLMTYDCTIRGFASDEVILEIEVKIPVTALCPCSKAISAEGAHNQRGIVTVSFRQERFVWIEEIIDIVESSASCDVYSVLKREDEKFVTEKAYQNPMFVEDVARKVAQDLSGIEGISWFSVEVENQESIHAHNAYAYLERTCLDNHGP